MFACNSTKNKDEIRSDSDLVSFGRILGMKKPAVKKFEY